MDILDILDTVNTIYTTYYVLLCISNYVFIRVYLTHLRSLHILEKGRGKESLGATRWSQCEAVQKSPKHSTDLKAARKGGKRYQAKPKKQWNFYGKKWQKWETKIINKGYIIDCRYICNDKVTTLPPNVTLKRRRSSSEPSGPRSYGFDRIKLHQVRVMSPVLLIHVSLRSTMQVLERIIQLCALR